MTADDAMLARIGAQLAAGGDGPLYVRLAEALAHEVDRHDATGGAPCRLPSERRMAAAIGISRVTVRRALAELASGGLIHRRQGARTSAAPRLEKALASLTGFSDELRARGMVPGHRWLARQVVQPSPAEAMSLDVAADSLIVRLVRVRLADGAPIAIERAAVPQDILPSGDLVGASLYAALAERNAPPVRGQQRIRAGVMSRIDAELLDSSPGRPLLIVERRCFLVDGRAVEFTETRYNGESYDFLTELGS